MCTYSILSSKSDLFLLGCGLRQGRVLSPILFMIFKDRVSRDSHGEEGLQFCDWQIPMLLFVDDVVLTISLPSTNLARSVHSCA